MGEDIARFSLVARKTGEVLFNFDEFSSPKESDFYHPRIRKVKVRKEHKCNICGRTINKGEGAFVVHWSEMKGRFIERNRFYYCKDCVEVVENTK